MLTKPKLGSGITDGARTTALGLVALILVSDLEIALNNRSAGIRSVAGQLVYSCLGQTVHGRGCDRGRCVLGRG